MSQEVQWLKWGTQTSIQTSIHIRMYFKNTSKLRYKTWLLTLFGRFNSRRQMQFSRSHKAQTSKGGIFVLPQFARN